MNPNVIRYGRRLLITVVGVPMLAIKLCLALLLLFRFVWLVVPPDCIPRYPVENNFYFSAQYEGGHYRPT